eukprot:scaffold679_cov284-Alexandrium_tamarense.AAC.4
MKAALLLALAAGASAEITDQCVDGMEMDWRSILPREDAAAQCEPDSLFERELGKSGKGSYGDWGGNYNGAFAIVALALHEHYHCQNHFKVVSHSVFSTSLH